MTGCLPRPNGRKTSARSTSPSSASIGTSHSICMPSRISLLLSVIIDPLTQNSFRHEADLARELTHLGDIFPHEIGECLRRTTVRFQSDFVEALLHFRLAERAHRF